MKRTKVFATQSEKKELKKLAEEAQNSNDNWSFTCEGMMGKSDPWAKVQERMEEIVKKHGLPLPASYGMLDTGEFITD